MNILTTREHGSAFLTVAEVAALLQCSEPTVRRRIRTGELPACNLGRQIRIDPADFRAYLEREER
jgi:excisionase family DNA binding protein